MLAVVGAFIGLAWSGSTASADTGRPSDSSAASHPEAQDAGLLGTANQILGTGHDGDHSHRSPITAGINGSAHEHARVSNHQAHQPATHSANHSTTQPAARRPQPPSNQTDGADHTADHSTAGTGGDKSPASDTSARTDHTAARSRTGHGADSVAGALTDTVSDTVHSTSRGVHGINSRVGSTADPVERPGQSHGVGQTSGPGAHGRTEPSKRHDTHVAHDGAEHSDHATTGNTTGHTTGHTTGNNTGNNTGHNTGHSKLDLSGSLGGVLHNVGDTGKAAGSVAAGGTPIVGSLTRPDRLGSATGQEIGNVTHVVHDSTKIIGSTGDVVGSTGRTVGDLGGDRSKPLGGIVGGVGDTVADVGATTGTVSRSVDRLSTGTGNAAADTVSTTLDDTVSTTGTVTDTLSSTVGRTVGDLGGTVNAVGGTVNAVGGTVNAVGGTVNAVGGTVNATVSGLTSGTGAAIGQTIDGVSGATRPIGSALQPPAGSAITVNDPGNDTGNDSLSDSGKDTGLHRSFPAPSNAGSSENAPHPPASQPPTRSATAVSRPAKSARPSHHRVLGAKPISLLGPGSSDHLNAARTNSPSPTDTPLSVLTGSLPIPTSGGSVPAPGELPQLASTVITGSSSGGVSYGIIRTFVSGVAGRVPDIRGPSPVPMQGAPYDPGYSPD